uniref:Membrane-spanning 4-domains, subfamily A, member 17C.1 n=1 Tax=Cyprinus carpio TaxID=7962 RepID=A0A8C2D2L0_CYPCA
MESSKVVSTDKPTVFIEVNPKVIQDTVIFFDGHEAGGKNHTTALKGFLKAQPKALGTVQIMIGVMVFLLGIVLTANFYIFSTISVISGITIWGSFIYISTGSLSVAAQNKLHPCVVCTHSKLKSESVLFTLLSNCNSIEHQSRHGNLLAVKLSLQL